MGYDRKQFACVIIKYLSVLIFLFNYGCSDINHNSREWEEYEIKVLRELSKAVEERRYSDMLAFSDKALSSTDNLSEDAQGIISAYKALTFVIIDQLDSAEKYIYDLESLIDKEYEYYNSLIGYTALGIYVIKKELDYSKAMGYFQKALSIAVETSDTANQVISLCNIATIYHLRSDTSGLIPAKEAYRLSKTIKNPHIIISSALTLSQMLLLAGKSEEAFEYMESITNSTNSRQFSEVELIKAQCLSASGNNTEAEAIYRELCESRNNSSLMTKIRMSYGEFLVSDKRFNEAIGQFESAIKVADQSNENKAPIYLLLSETYSNAGNDRESLKYYKLYHKYYDSLEIHEKEIQLNNAIQRYEKLKYDKQIARKELAVEKARKNTVVAVSLILVISIVALFLGILYRKTNFLYRKLVEQHQQYVAKESQLRKTNCVNAPVRNDDDKDRILFERIERLMEEDKIYQMNDISLNKLAELLSSNRAYISKVINRFSGQSFSEYINSKRIGAAIAELSDPDNDIPLKMLSDNLGYNTLSTFYRAFQKDTGCPPSKYRSGIRQLRK